jgi:tRNA-specific 2-thiouridylase
MKAQVHVYVAMSGGVDSSVAAVRLLSEGYQVTGIYMDTWRDPKWLDASRSPAQVDSVAKAAQSIGIPLIAFDVKDQFFREIVQNFISGYLAGETPNPCLLCNPQVKWGILQNYALAQGADFFATGHYARLKQDARGHVQLLRGLDQTKDQSYVLSMLSQTQLQRSLLPLGEMTKDAVRKFARELNLPSAEGRESQDLCFLGDVDYRDFLKRYAPEGTKPGEIVNLEGRVLGQHQGLAFYTIGQRKGIRIAAEEPFFVIGKDTHNNRLIVGFDKQAGKIQLNAVNPNWILGELPNEGEVYDVMVRYRAQPEKAKLLSVSMDKFRLEFNRPLRGITPGQVAVVYQGEVCLGGGLIKNAK